MPTTAQIREQTEARLAAIQAANAERPKAPAPSPFVPAEADRKADGRRSPDEVTIGDTQLQRALRKSADEHLQRALRESAEEQARHARELEEFKSALEESLKTPLKKPPVATEDYNLQAAIMESIQATLEETRKAVEGATRDPSTQAIATEALGYVDGRISQMLKMYMEEFTLRMETRNRNEALTEKLEAANTENAEKIGELTEKLEAAKTENAEKIGELEKEHAEKIEKIEQDHVEKRDQEHTELAQQLKKDHGELAQQLQTERDENAKLRGDLGTANDCYALAQSQYEAVSRDLEQANDQNSENADKWLQSRKQLVAENAGLVAERDGLVAENAGLVAERDGLVAEKAGLVAERDGLVAERDGLVAERDGLVAEKAGLVAEKAGLVAENAGLARQLAAAKAAADAELTQQLTDAKAEKAENAERADNLQLSLTALINEKAEKAKLVQQLQDEKVELEKQLEAEKVTADAELTEKLAVEKASLQKALVDLKNDLIGAQNTIVDSNARFEAEKAKAEDLAKQIASAEVECTDAEVEAETAETAAEVAEVARGKKAKKAKKVEKVEGPEGAAETGDSETESDMSTARDLSTYVAALKALGNLAHVSAFLKLGFGDSIASFKQLRGMPEFQDWKAKTVEEFVDEAATYLGFSDTILADLRTKTDSVYLQAVIYGVRAWAKMMGERIVANTITGADFLFDEAIENGNTTAAIVLDMMRPDPSRSTEGATFEVWHAVPNRGKNRTVTNWADVGYVSTVKLDTKVRTIFQTRGPDFVNKFVKE